MRKTAFNCNSIDQSGFIKSEIATSDKTVVTNLYSYDSRAQLVSNATITTYNGEVVENTETTYTYDNAGNRLSSVKKSGENLLCNITYVYNDNSQITDITGSCDEDESKDKHVVLSYDANGNLIKTQCNDTEKVMDYTYDNENRLKAVKENGTLLMAALYDGNGDRIFRVDYRKNPKYISNLGGTAENVYYNYASGGISYDHEMIKDEMLIPNGVTQNSSINYELTGYINDINSQYTQVLMEYGANQSITNIYEYGDQRNSGTFNGKKGYYLYDGRGSVSSVSGQTGGNMVSYTYDAYGNTTVNTGSPLNNPYQYNAEYTDSSTGNQYLRARYYDPASGRFLTKDTYLGEISDPLSKNPYAYTRNNPINLIDPSGYLFEEIFGVGAGAGKAVWDGVGGLFTGKGFSGFKSGWDDGYKAGSSLGREWDNAIGNAIDNSRNNNKVKKIDKANRDLQDLQNAFISSTNGKDKAKIRKQIEELEQKRRKLCDQAEKLQKQMDDRGKTDYVKIPDAFIVSLPEKTLEEEYYKINESKQKNVKVKVSDNNITIDVHVNFTGDIDAPISGSSDTFRELTIVGIEAWSGNYNAFGYDTNVNVNVVEDSNGLIVNLTDGPGRAHVSSSTEWHTNRKSTVELFTEASGGGARTPEQVSSTAAHEFGHIFGLGDAYGEGKRPDAAIADSGANGIMRNHWKGINISDKDIQMIIYAWSNNEEQFYQSYGSYDRSPALDK